MRRNSNKNVLRARALRRTTSLPEGLLWQILRKRPGGFKFRHQHPIDPYVADFYCAAKRLVIEVDGDVHTMGDNPERDARRDTWLRRGGYRVIRFNATDVLNNLDGVAVTILGELAV